MPLEGVHGNRGRAESFGSLAERYDRFRSGYPESLVDHLVFDHPSNALDVGCGTGKVATAVAGRGVRVVGVEPDDRMAQVARNHGVRVCIASFETWDSKGQLFDLITCGHAWHWIDPAVGLAKAASLLRPGGAIELFWNYHVLDQSVLEHIDAAYQAYGPELNVLGHDPTGAADTDPFGGSAAFTGGQARTYRWVRDFDGEEWAEMVGTFSDHQALGEKRLSALQEAVRRIIDEHGVIRAQCGTYAWSARKRPSFDAPA